MGIASKEHNTHAILLWLYCIFTEIPGNDKPRIRNIYTVSRIRGLYKRNVVGHIRAYTNPRTVLDPFGFRQFYLKRPGERLVLAGEVNHQLEVVIVHIDGLYEIP